ARGRPRSGPATPTPSSPNCRTGSGKESDGPPLTEPEVKPAACPVSFPDQPEAPKPVKQRRRRPWVVGVMTAFALGAGTPCGTGRSGDVLRERPIPGRRGYPAGSPQIERPV